VNEDDLRRLAAVGTETEVPAGQVLVERGQPGSGLYVILEGTVTVEAPEGRHDLGEGTVIGERSLVSIDGLRTARVRARSDVRVLAVTRSAFESLAVDDAELARRVFEAAS
jgi:CRP-like cAMP-binding protein